MIITFLLTNQWISIHSTSYFIRKPSIPLRTDTKNEFKWMGSQKGRNSNTLKYKIFFMYILIMNPERCINLCLRSQGTRARRWFRGCLKSRVGECSSSLLAVSLFVWQRYTRGKTMSLHLFYCLSGNQETHWLLSERQEAQRPAAQAGERRMAVLRDCRPGRKAALRADTDLRGLRNLSSNILGQAELCPAESAAAPLPGFAGFRNDGGPGSGWRRDTRETTPSRNPVWGEPARARPRKMPRSRGAEGPKDRTAD